MLALFLNFLPTSVVVAVHKVQFYKQPLIVRQTTLTPIDFLPILLHLVWTFLVTWGRAWGITLLRSVVLECPVFKFCKLPFQIFNAVVLLQFLCSTISSLPVTVELKTQVGWCGRRQHLALKTPLGKVFPQILPHTARRVWGPDYVAPWSMATRWGVWIWIQTPASHRLDTSQPVS